MSAPTVTRPPAGPAAPPPPRRLSRLRDATLVETRWRVGLASAVAVLLASLALAPLLEGLWWFWPSIAVVAAVALAGAAVRVVRAPAPLQPLAQAVALLVTLVVLFAGESARWGLLPGPAAITALRELAASGRAFAEQTVAPAGFDPGLQLLIVAGVGLVALVVDTLAVGLDLPGLTLAPLGALFVVAWAIGGGSAPWQAFVVVGLAWLLVLAATQRDRVTAWGAGARPGSPLVAFGIGALAVLLALASGGLTALRGPVDPIANLGIGTGQGTLALDAMVSLRRSLVENDTRVVLTFASTAPTPDYLRLAVLEAFDGEQWRAAGEPVLGPRAPVAPAGSGAASGSLVEYRLDVGPLTGTTVPSPSGTIASLNDWPVAFDQRTSLPVRTDGDTIEGERIGLVAAASVLDADQLDSASRLRAPGDQLDPANLADPTPLVGRELGALAREVTDGASTPYEVAIALQRWFTADGGFTYSTAIEGGSDGDALAAFLDERVGYCEQFAATMALMARSLGIPARVVVGFTQGRREGPEWVVRGTDAHAWPELWMGSAGWVRFEPTPGAATTTTPQYARETVENAGPSAAPPSASADAGAGVDRQEDIPEDFGANAAGDGGSTSDPRLMLLLAPLVLLLMLLPAAARMARRRRRLARGDGEAAFAEVADTVADLGHTVPDATPRAMLAAVRVLVGTGSRPDAPAGHGPAAVPPGGPGEVGAALDRIQRAVEWQRYGPAGAAPATRRGALAGDVQVIRQALAASCGRGRRLTAVLLPRSLARPAGGDGGMGEGPGGSQERATSGPTDPHAAMPSSTG
jgi:transglutaminase-like putative cysteine protease